MGVVASFDRRSPRGPLDRAPSLGLVTSMSHVEAPSPTMLLLLTLTEMMRRRAAHRALVDIADHGASFSSKHRVVSEFGDPLASSPGDVSAFSRRFASLVTPEKPRFSNWTAQQDFSIGVIRGTSYFKFDDGLTEHKIGNISVNGRSVDFGPLRQLLVSGGEYDVVAQVSQRAIGLVTRNAPEPPRIARPPEPPDADKLGTPAFEAYDRAYSLMCDLKEHIRTLDDFDVYAPNVRVFGLLGEPVPRFDRNAQSLRKAVSSLGAMRDALSIEIQVEETFFDGTSLTLDVTCSVVVARPFTLKASFNYTLADKVVAARLATLDLDGRKVKPSALASYLAKFFVETEDDFPVVGAAKTKASSPQDATALVRLAQALHASLVPALVSGSPSTFVDAAGVAPDVQVRGLLNENLLNSKTDFTATLKAATSLLRLFKLEPKLRSVAIEPDGATLLLTLALTNNNNKEAVLLVIAATIAQGHVVDVVFRDVQAAGARVLPASLASTLARARDLGAASRDINTLLFPSSSRQR